MARTAAVSPAHPPFIDMVKEAIIDSKERTGISRASIKKFLEIKYKMDVNAHVISSLNRAIKTGTDKNVFSLPKGPSGKVKLAPKIPSDISAKENANPTPRTTTTKKAAGVKAKTKKPLAPSGSSSKVTKAKSVGTKKVVAPKAATKTAAAKVKAKKATTTKPTTTKSAAAKVAAKPTAAKKSTPKAATKAKKQPSSKVTPKKLATGTKPVSKTKPTSKASAAAKSPKTKQAPRKSNAPTSKKSSPRKDA